MDSKNQPSSSSGPDITTTVSNAGRGKEDDDEDINNLIQGVRKSHAHGQIELSMISPNMANRVAHVALRICLVLS